LPDTVKRAAATVKALRSLMPATCSLSATIAVMDAVPESLNFSAELWEWPARASWFFVSVPLEESLTIADTPRPPRGFGSIRVEVTIGSTRFTTSMFPDSPSNQYVLPIKKAVRTAEGIEAPDTVEVHLRLLE